MCRIAGIIDKGMQPAELQQKIKVMCQALQHGGPDDEGVFFDDSNHIGFGHRRLSIIDLSNNGHQPMADISQKAWITFNGELYNYLELKAELLRSGAQFKSATDTEVILLAYLQWGTAAFAKFRGMFAFALYDNVNKLVYLVRDSAGIKPIYYYARNGALSFASETRAFTAANITTEKDANWLVRFLAFGHIPEPYTTLKNIFSLPKGHFLRWDMASSAYTISSYTGTLVQEQVTDITEARSHIKNTLIKSVNRQLIADATIGVFLSGGIDSSLLTLLANQKEEQQLKMVSIYFNEQNYNEQHYQRIILDKLQGQSFSHLVRKQDFDTFLPQIIAAMDMPTTDGINSWFISKYAHEDGLKAVLSGIGADEYLGGYPSFNRIKYLKYLRKVDPSLFSVLTGILPDQYKKLTFLSHDHHLADYLLLRGLFSPDDIARFLDTDSKQVREILFDTSSIAFQHSYTGQHASWLETNLYMQNQLLRDTDVMSMSHGLEVRVPFLDEDLTRVIDHIDPSIRFDGRQPKKLLIDSFNDLLPPAIWNRPKMGFTFPLQQWMMDHPDISNSQAYKGLPAQSVIKKFKNKGIHWSKAFALYQIQAHV
jgi:asparagine synthase (glutamine-hydrolysing)